MKERPILFSAPMVHTILERRKTQTRRAMKPQPEPTDIIDGWRWHYKGQCGGWCGSAPQGILSYCPYGVPGDRLWVREALRRAPGAMGNITTYAADRACVPHEYATSASVEWPWKVAVLSARYMPRWASRITLEVTDVRVQRLHKIRTDDARSEGFDPAWAAMNGFGEKYAPILWYSDLWDKLYFKRGFGWTVNPWVWAITFKRISTGANTPKES
jgi:hypothetical protein